MELVVETSLTLVEVDLLNVRLRTVTKYNTSHLLRGILSKCHEDRTIQHFISSYFLRAGDIPHQAILLQ